jgi:signal peptidase II
MVIATRVFLVLVVLLACVGCDQSTKRFAEAKLPGSQPLSFLADTVRLQTVKNTGAFLGMGQSAPRPWRLAALRWGVAMLLAGLLAYAVFASHTAPSTVFALALIFSGGVSNLIDRMTNDGYVVDFINLGIGTLRTGIFNVADVAITLGALLLVMAQAHRHG